MTTTVQGSLTVRRIKNGNDGAQGLKGCITRIYENGLVLNQEYRNDDADNTSMQDGGRYADFVAWQVDKTIVASGYIVYQALHTFISNIDLPDYNEQTVEGIVDSQGRKALKKIDINAATAFFNFILARKIKADEIDVDNLIVKNVNAVSSDGTTTTNIDGSTGKFTAKNIDVGGNILANTLELKISTNTYDNIVNGSICIGQNGGVLPNIQHYSTRNIKVFNIRSTRAPSELTFTIENNNVSIFKGYSVVEETPLSSITLDYGSYEFIGYKEDNSNITKWILNTYAGNVIAYVEKI